MRDLPYDIWLQIVQHLPNHQIRSLYAVNRALYDIALDLRYKDASIGILPDRVIEETKPPILRSRRLSPRPTALEMIFYDTSNRSGPNVMEPNFLSSLKTFLPSIISNRGLEPQPVPPTIKLSQILHAMPKLTRVTELRFASVHHSFGFKDSEVSQIFPAVVGFIGNRLRALKIQSPFVAYLPPRIESLESFALDALAPYHTLGFHLIMVEKFPTFIRAHERTLRKVSFSMDALSGGKNYIPMDISPILQSLRHISCLHSLNLSLPYDATKDTNAVPEFEQLHRILETHQQHLKTITLNYNCDHLPDSAMAYFSQEWALVNFPSLKCLTLCLPGIRYNEANLHRFSHSLSSLKIAHVSPSPAIYHGNPNHELESFCDMLSIFPCLQDLSLHVSNFSIEHLVIFSRNLPRLRSLHVDTYSTALVADFENFMLRMKPTAFADWALESLDYKTHGPWTGWMDRQMAIRLPNVTWINKKTRKECLSGPLNKPRKSYIIDFLSD